MELVGVFGLAAFACLMVWLEARKERDLPTEEPEYEDDGAWQWPARRVGPVGRARIEDRRIG